jgi:hypothetical protein
MGLFQSSVICFLLASTILAIDIPAAPTWPASGRCTDRSLTIPSWVTRDYKVTAGVATFRVQNRASDESPDYFAHVTCQPGKSKCDSYAGSHELRIDWTVGGDGASVISLSEFWICSDEGDKYADFYLNQTEARRLTFVNMVGSRSLLMAMRQSRPARALTASPPSHISCQAPSLFLYRSRQRSHRHHLAITAHRALMSAKTSGPFRMVRVSICSDIYGFVQQWLISDILVEYKHYTKSQCKLWYIEHQFCIDPEFGDLLQKGTHLKLKVTNNAISHEVPFLAVSDHITTNEA